MPVAKTKTKKAPIKKKPQKDKGGRPTAFQPEYCEQVVKLCRLGATDNDLADFFNVVVATIQNWKRTHPEFLDSVRAGKIESDMQVANSLFKKATGYKTKVEKVVGSGADKHVVEVEVSHEPDTQAAMFWLKNRRKDEWRDKQEIDINDKTQTDEQIKARLVALMSKASDDDADEPRIH